MNFISQNTYFFTYFGLDYKHRNKLIKIADTSDGGWDTARQYEANPIASDSDDESKIIRAENRAIRKKKSKNKSSGPKYCQ
jgi:hypothetical protein